MARKRVELAICGTLAALCAARGISAIWSQSYWLAGRLAPPAHYVGAKAVLLGIGEIGLAALMMAAWLWFSRGDRRAGAALAAVGALAFVGGFTIGLFG